MSLKTPGFLLPFPSKEQGFLSNDKIQAVLTTFYLKLSHQGRDRKGARGEDGTCESHPTPGGMGSLL